MWRRPPTPHLALRLKKEWSCTSSWPVVGWTLRSPFKDCRCVGLTILPPLCTDCLEIWELEPSGPVQAYNGIAFTYLYMRLVVFSHSELPFEFRKPCCPLIERRTSGSLLSDCAKW